MWFVFGFFSLISFSLYSIYQRITANWVGKQSYVRRKLYEYKVVYRRTDVGEGTEPVGLQIGVTASTRFDFSLKPEKWRDWVSNQIGFSVEYQTGDSKFDRAVYILSNDARIHAVLSQNSELRADILKVFNIVAPHSAQLKEIRCAKGRIWVHYKLKNGLLHTKIAELAEQIVPALNRFASDLGKVAIANAPRLYDRFVLRASVILAISTGLAMNGVAHLVRLHFIPIPFPIDRSALIEWSIYCGIVLIGLLVLSIVLFLGRSARAHVVLFEVLLVGGLGAIVTSYVEMRDLNMEWDQRPAVRHEVRVESMRSYRGRRYRSYYITVKGWPEHNRTREFEVSSSLYYQSKQGMKMEVWQKPGYFNVPWVAALTPLKSTSGIENSTH